MKPIHVLMFALVAGMALLAACGPSAAPTQEAAQPAPVVEQPTLALPPATEPPPAVVEPTQPQYAPFCQAAPAACEAPAVEMRDNKMCPSKQLHVLLWAPAGTTYEALDPGLECWDQMRGDGDMNITCRPDKELWSYELKVCNGACSAPALAMDTGQCPAGYGFDAANQCCAAPAPAAGDGCTVFKVDVGACSN
ncbi:MAG: hypothetical protein ACOYYJ_13630 [Chloroflexota bacterium]